jgi:hypothetical protein
MQSLDGPDDGWQSDCSDADVGTREEAMQRKQGDVLRLPSFKGGRREMHVVTIAAVRRDAEGVRYCLQGRDSLALWIRESQLFRLEALAAAPAGD